MTAARAAILSALFAQFAVSMIYLTVRQSPMAISVACLVLGAVSMVVAVALLVVKR